MQTQKKSQAFESGMMELSAIRHRLQEGIAANARHEAQESQRVASTEHLRVQFLAFVELPSICSQLVWHAYIGLKTWCCFRSRRQLSTRCPSGMELGSPGWGRVCVDAQQALARPIGTAKSWLLVQGVALHRVQPPLTDVAVHTL